MASMLRFYVRLHPLLGVRVQVRASTYLASETFLYISSTTKAFARHYDCHEEASRREEDLFAFLRVGRHTYASLPTLPAYVAVAIEM